MHDIIVIGAGPCGMTAALYALRAGKTVLVIEGESFGGQIAFSPCVKNYPAIEKISGNQFADNLLTQITTLGADIEFAKVTHINTEGKTKIVTTEDNNSFECKAVIIAAGVKHRHLGLENEEKLIGNGISYCAVCDGAFFKGKDVAVLGGGDTALTDALYLSAICNKVYIIHRRNEFRGEKALSDKVRTIQNITLLLESTVTKLISENDVLSGIVVASDKEETAYSLSGLFIAIGQIPQNEPFKNLEKQDNSGYFETDESTISKTEGIFIAGDCRQKGVRQLATAISDGATAGTYASRYIDRF